MTIVLEFLKKAWPYLISGIVVIALFAFGLHWLHARDAVQFAAGQANVQQQWDNAKAAQAAAAASDAAVQAKAQVENTTAAESAAASDAQAQQQIQVVYRTITNTVTKYVHDHPAVAACGLDDDGLKLWNNANAGKAQ